MEVFMGKERFECSSCSKEPTGRINVGRFIAKLDECFKTDDLAEAARTVEYWENEARSLNDACGLLSVLNEEIGLYRRMNEKDKALRAVRLAKEIVDFSENNDVSRATVMVNAATTLKAFGYPAEGLPYFDKAEEIYIDNGKKDSFEHAALLNNKSSSLCDLKRYDEGEKCLNYAIEILKKEGKHDGEIAVSLINLAHLTYDRDENSYEAVEAILDKAWEYINSENQPHDANYAFIISKCAPSLRYFKRELEAEALEQTAAEIYGNK